MLIGENTDHMRVEPMKSESASFMALQDFTRKHGMPHTIKTDDTQAETGVKWTEHCRRHHIGQKHTETMHPWQNYAEHDVKALSVIVRRTMRQCKIPLMNHHWVQKWCSQIRNCLALRRLKWRCPYESWHGHTPEMSKFRFHA